MKKMFVCFFLFSLLFIISPAFAVEDSGESETVVQSVIEKVTVYSDRAVVERSATFEMVPGTHSFVFDDLPEGINADSLQLKGQGQAVQEDIIFRTKSYAEIPDERIKAIQAKRDEADSKVQNIADSLSRLNSEIDDLKKIMDRVTSVAAKEDQSGTELNPEKWLPMLKFHRERLTAIDLEKRGLEKDQKTAKAELGRIDEELLKLTAGRKKKKNQAIAVLSSTKTGKVALNLSYTVLGPSWTPAYDIRVDSEKKTVQIAYNATISQNSGEDWNGVVLSLSTARAEINGTQPELTPWYLSLYSNMDKSMETLSAVGMAQMMPNVYETRKSISEVEAKPVPVMAVKSAVAQTGATSVVFDVPGKANIASDTLKHRVNITGLNLPAYFRYSTAPKLSTFAYLKAKITNGSDFPLLEGSSKVFLDGNFVADATLSATAPGQEFWVFLGVDESIKVEYKLVNKKRDESGVFDKKNLFVYQYETKITNTKKTDIELVLWDQLPISTDKSIVVKLIEPKYTKDSEALKKSNQDIFEWLMKFKPAESVTVPLSFSVEYPQDVEIEGLDF